MRSFFIPSAMLTALLADPNEAFRANVFACIEAIRRGEDLADPPGRFSRVVVETARQVLHPPPFEPMPETPPSYLYQRQQAEETRRNKSAAMKASWARRRAAK